MTVTVSRDKVFFGYFNMLEKRISKNTHFDWKRSYKSIHVTVIAVGSVDVNTLHIGGNGWVSNNANDGKEDKNCVLTKCHFVCLKIACSAITDV